MSLLRIAALVAASFGGGLLSSFATGGTLLTFSALVLLGFPSIVSNATSTVALLPASLATMAGYRGEISAHRRLLSVFLLPGVAGGAAGAALLLATPERSFARLAPFLILFATLLFTAQEIVLRARASATSESARDRTAAGVFLLAAIAVYEGYFGAGSGILALVAIGYLGVPDIHAANGLKAFFMICINLVAAVLFLARGAVNLPAAGVITAGAAVGAYAGARLAIRIGKQRARLAVIAIGLVTTAALLYKQWR